MAGLEGNLMPPGLRTRCSKIYGRVAQTFHPRESPCALQSSRVGGSWLSMGRQLYFTRPCALEQPRVARQRWAFFVFTDITITQHQLIRLMPRCAPLEAPARRPWSVQLATLVAGRATPASFPGKYHRANLNTSPTQKDH